MAKIPQANNRNIWSAAVLCLALIAGFASLPALRGNTESQGHQIELVTRNFSQRKTVKLFFATNRVAVFLKVCLDVVKRLATFNCNIKIALTENLKSEMLARWLKMERLYTSLGNLNSPDAYIIRG
ncbi:MAG TPA: hypothetical protein VFZ52_04990 [Chryseolinea sp.]